MQLNFTDLKWHIRLRILELVLCVTVFILGIIMLFVDGNISRIIIIPIVAFGFGFGLISLFSFTYIKQNRSTEHRIWALFLTAAICAFFIIAGILLFPLKKQYLSLLILFCFAVAVVAGIVYFIDLIFTLKGIFRGIYAKKEEIFVPVQQSVNIHNQDCQTDTILCADCGQPCSKSTTKLVEVDYHKCETCKLRINEEIECKREICFPRPIHLETEKIDGEYNQKRTIYGRLLHSSKVAPITTDTTTSTSDLQRSRQNDGKCSVTCCTEDISFLPEERLDIYQTTRGVTSKDENKYKTKLIYYDKLSELSQEIIPTTENRSIQANISECHDICKTQREIFIDRNIQTDVFKKRHRKSQTDSYKESEEQIIPTNLNTISIKESPIMLDKSTSSKNYDEITSKPFIILVKECNPSCTDGKNLGAVKKRSISHPNSSKRDENISKRKSYSVNTSPERKHKSTSIPRLENLDKKRKLCIEKHTSTRDEYFRKNKELQTERPENIVEIRIHGKLESNHDPNTCEICLCKRREESPDKVHPSQIPNNILATNQPYLPDPKRKGVDKKSTIIRQASPVFNFIRPVPQITPKTSKIQPANNSVATSTRRNETSTQKKEIKKGKN